MVKTIRLYKFIDCKELKNYEGYRIRYRGIGRYTYDGLLIHFSPETGCGEIYNTNEDNGGVVTFRCIVGDYIDIDIDRDNADESITPEDKYKEIESNILEKYRKAKVYVEISTGIYLDFILEYIKIENGGVVAILNRKTVHDDGTIESICVTHHCIDKNHTRLYKKEN